MLKNKKFRIFVVLLQASAQVPREYWSREDYQPAVVMFSTTGSISHPSTLYLLWSIWSSSRLAQDPKDGFFKFGLPHQTSFPAKPFRTQKIRNKWARFFHTRANGEDGKKTLYIREANFDGRTHSFPSPSWVQQHNFLDHYGMEVPLFRCDSEWVSESVILAQSAFQQSIG